MSSQVVEILSAEEVRRTVNRMTSQVVENQQKEADYKPIYERHVASLKAFADARPEVFQSVQEDLHTALW